MNDLTDVGVKDYYHTGDVCSLPDMKVKYEYKDTTRFVCRKLCSDFHDLECSGFFYSRLKVTDDMLFIKGDRWYAFHLFIYFHLQWDFMFILDTTTTTTTTTTTKNNNNNTDPLK